MSVKGNVHQKRYEERVCGCGAKYVASARKFNTVCERCQSQIEREKAVIKSRKMSALRKAARAAAREATS